MKEFSPKSLRQFLFSLPTASGFVFSENVRTEIRKTLFKAVSCDGKYLDFIFPGIELPQLDKDIQWSIRNFVAHSSKVSSESEEMNPHAFHSGSPCARIFRRGEPIYKCLTCGFNDTCALCSHCFQRGSHEGHNVNVSICVRENGGVCDCGDPEAWVKDFVCIYHEMNESFERLRNLAPESDLKSAVLDTVGVLLDFIIDVMCRSDQQFLSIEGASSIYWQSRLCELDPLKYGFDASRNCVDEASPKYALIAYNDQVRHFRDAFQRIHLTSKKVPEFADMVAKRIQDHGRATIIRSGNVELLFERQKVLSATGLSSCIRNVRDEFREEMCFEIVHWLEDFSACHLVKANETLRNLFCQAFCMRWVGGLAPLRPEGKADRSIAQLDENLDIPAVCKVDTNDAVFWRRDPKAWEHIETLCQECGFSIFDLHDGRHFGSRLQYLTYLDIRFWKAFRLSLHTMYASSLITNLKWKGMVCYQYCDVYPFVSNMFLNLDGDPETNVMCTLSCQLFISPSNSSAILINGDVTRIFGTIYSFLKTGNTHSSPLRPDSDLSLISLKNRRWGQLFFDVGYIVSRGQNGTVSLTDTVIPMTCELLALFQGKPTMRRETENHIEYENTDYTAFFHAIPVIYQLADYVSQCLKNLDDSSKRTTVFKDAIKFVIQFIIQLEKRYPGTQDHNEVDYAPERPWLFEHDRVTGQIPVSFLHPLHSFLSWLIEYASFGDRNELLEVLGSSCNSPHFPSHSHRSSLMQLFFYPVQSVVLAAQVKTGFWVRNGFSVKNQYQLYKSTGLREQGYLRDIFLIQIYLICYEPELTVENVLKIWLLDEGESANENCPYDAVILPYILEECLSFFLHVLTEGLFSKRLTTNEIIKMKIEDEIIHQLALGSMNYSKLCSQIPDHIVSERSFDSILEEVSTFKEPKTGKESGTFVLKESFYERVNPYYHNYSSNKKDECLKIMKERQHKLTNQPLNEIVISPISIQLAQGVYTHLGRFTTARAFIQFLRKCLQFVLFNESQKFDGLFDTLLHLIHTCAFKLPSHNSSHKAFCVAALESAAHNPSLGSLLYSGLSRDDFKEHHAKLRAIFQCIMNEIDNFFTIANQTFYKFDATLLSESSAILTENDLERKKRIALQRQAKLMEKFRKQQSSFILKNNVLADSSDAEMEDAEVEGWRFPDSHCILCQDTAKDAGPFGLIVHISRSSEFRDLPFDDKYWFLKGFSDNCNLNENDENSLPEMKTKRFMEFMKHVESSQVIGPGFKDAKHISNKLVSVTCGHGMHFNCYVQFLGSNRSRSSHITRNTPDNIEHREFLCPLCKALNNLFVPVLWTANDRSLKEFLHPSPSNDDPFASISQAQVRDESWLDRFCKAASTDLQEFSIISNSGKDLIGRHSESSVSTGQQQFRVLLSNMFQILSLLTFPQVFKADSSNILVNTIKSNEISLRGVSSDSGLIPHQVSNNALINLRALNEFRITSLSMKTSNWLKSFPHKPDTHLKILSNILLLCPENFNETILRHDFMEILVDVFPIPSLGFTFNKILEVCFVGHIIQSFHTITTKIIEKNFFANEGYSLVDVPYSEMIAEEDGSAALQIFRKFGEQMSRFPLNALIEHPAFGKILYSMVLKSVTPFLRQAAIYAFVNCHCDSEPTDDGEDAIFEADKLCFWLNLQTLSKAIKEMATSDYISASSASSRFQSFLAFIDQSSRNMDESSDICKSIEYPGRISLVRLPTRLDEFFTKFYYSEKFDFPHLNIENPAICMFCGNVRDIQKAALGSKFGQCSVHFMKECPNTVGIFLLPKDRSILLLNKNGGSFHPIPYLDQHFEVAGDNKKTKVVFLSKKRYEDFVRTIWLQHNISNYIVRKLDGVIDAGGWETL